MPDAHPTTFEEFREIPGVEGYRFWTDGTIQSRRRCGNTKKRLGDRWRTLKVRLDRRGYQIVILRINKRSINYFAHTLILTAFVGPCPEGMECCHCDGNPLNNRLSNIRWDTRSANMEDSRRHGTLAIGERVGGSKLTRGDVIEIRRLFKLGVPRGQIASRFGIHYEYIFLIARRDTWKHVGD
jgi:hypothetical protein